MNNVGEKFLPIGTVVMLNGGTKRIMITGFCSMDAEDQSQMYDYAGCMYPEGFLSSDQTALFNHSQIVQVYHMGLVDEEEKEFKKNLNTLVAQMQGGVAPQTTETTQPTVVPVQPAEAPVPPIGPGLPGYVAPATASAPSAPTATGGYTFAADGTVLAAPAAPTPSAPAATGGYTFAADGTVLAAPATTPAPSAQPTSIQFDADGTVISD